MLDEPTTGVDPKASRIIWNILSKVRQAGTALVLTSHSMEECEALCTQIAIMVSGEFRCLGSTQHIKSKYGNGYSLTIRLRQPNQIKRTKELVAEMFHDSLLKDEHILHLNYELVAEKGQTWSMLFEKVEKLVNLVDAADYSISQTTLDQIFLDFSRNARFNGTDVSRIIISRPCQGPKESCKNIDEGSELSSVSGTTSTGATSTAVSNTGTTSSA